MDFVVWDTLFLSTIPVSVTQPLKAIDLEWFRGTCEPREPQSSPCGITACSDQGCSPIAKGLLSLQCWPALPGPCAARAGRLSPAGLRLELIAVRMSQNVK